MLSVSPLYAANVAEPPVVAVAEPTAEPALEMAILILPLPVVTWSAVTVYDAAFLNVALAVTFCAGMVNVLVLPEPETLTSTLSASLTVRASSTFPRSGVMVRVTVSPAAALLISADREPPAPALVVIV